MGTAAEKDGIKGQLRALPSVDHLMGREEAAGLCVQYGRPLLIEAVRAALEQAREEIRAGGVRPSVAELLQAAEQHASHLLEPSLQNVINATGVIIHTNLGRAPLSKATREAMSRAGGGYSNLEYDLDEGRRGSRYLHAERLLCRLTGAEAALVVNNNAGAVLLALTALAHGRQVIISRSQLIEIGGGFRIPEVMAQSGASLVEVGTTNRTRITDYESAINPETALLMRAHPSNFRIVGFTEEPALAELAQLGQRFDLPVLDDLGSGSLLDTGPFGLEREPTIQESLLAGVSLVTFSGDKLLGGPQAGIILGRRAFVECLKHHPLTRALRVDKVTLAGLQATLGHYLRDEALREIPIWRMIAEPAGRMEELVHRWANRLITAGVAASVQAGHSTVGGGSLPGSALPTWRLAIEQGDLDVVQLAGALRAGRPPLVGIIQEGQLLFDPRTVLPEEREIIVDVILAAIDQLYRGSCS